MRHAIRTTKIAAVGYRYAQIAQGARTQIGDRRRKRLVVYQRCRWLHRVCVDGFVAANIRVAVGVDAVDAGGIDGDVSIPARRSVCYTQMRLCRRAIMRIIINDNRRVRAFMQRYAMQSCAAQSCAIQNRTMQHCTVKNRAMQLDARRCP